MRKIDSGCDRDWLVNGNLIRIKVSRTIFWWIQRRGLECSVDLVHGPIHGLWIPPSTRCSKEYELKSVGLQNYIEKEFSSYLTSGHRSTCLCYLKGHIVIFNGYQFIVISKEGARVNGFGGGDQDKVSVWSPYRSWTHGILCYSASPVLGLHAFTIIPSCNPICETWNSCIMSQSIVILLSVVGGSGLRYLVGAWNHGKYPLSYIEAAPDSWFILLVLGCFGLSVCLFVCFDNEKQYTARANHYFLGHMQDNTLLWIYTLTVITITTRETGPVS